LIVPALIVAAALTGSGEEPGEVDLDGKAWPKRGDRCVGIDVGRVDVQFSSPDQPGRDALLDNPLEEALEDRKPVPLADAGQAGVVGQGVAQVIPEGPSAG
jgi:hypothetical protein